MQFKGFPLKKQVETKPSKKAQEPAPGTAKLLKVSLNLDGSGGKVDRIYTFPDAVLPKTGYLNDVRVDGKGFAYITVISLLLGSIVNCQGCFI